MSILIVPQLSSKTYKWKPEVANNEKLVESLFKLVENKAMNMEIMELFDDYSTFECIKFSSNTGTAENIIFNKCKGPVVFYKKNGFNEQEKVYMFRMLEKVKGKQVMIV